MKITSKGQVTIPQEYRARLGLLPNSEVEFILDGNTLRIQKKRSSQRRGKSLVSHLKGKATVKMSTEDIMKLTRG